MPKKMTVTMVYSYLRGLSSHQNGQKLTKTEAILTETDIFHIL